MCSKAVVNTVHHSMLHTSTPVYDSTVDNYANEKSETRNTVAKETANGAPFHFIYLTSVFTALRLLQ